MRDFIETIVIAILTVSGITWLFLMTLFVKAKNKYLKAIRNLGVWLSGIICLECCFRLGELKGMAPFFMGFMMVVMPFVLGIIGIITTIVIVLKKKPEVVQAP